MIYYYIKKTKAHSVLGVQNGLRFYNSGELFAIIRIYS